MNAPSGKEIYKIAQEMFQTDKVTPEQISFVMDMLRPSAYLLRNHTIKNKPMTFYISGRNSERAQAHRPWQIPILNDSHPNLAVIKSRQLGLSELSVGKLIHFLDTRSYDAVKAIYAFPKLCGAL